MEIIKGSKFKNMVRGAGLTVKDVCDHAGVSEATASQWSKNNRSILLATYEKLIKSYEILSGKKIDDNF